MGVVAMERPLPTQGRTGRRLHLDDLGAIVGQQAGAEGARDVLADVEDADAVESAYGQRGLLWKSWGLGSGQTTARAPCGSIVLGRDFDAAPIGFVAAFSYLLDAAFLGVEAAFSYLGAATFVAEINVFVAKKCRIGRREP